MVGIWLVACGRLHRCVVGEVVDGKCGPGRGVRGIEVWV